MRPQNEKPGAPGLILWPESPAPFWTTDLHLRSTLANMARATDSYIIAGSIGIEHTGDPNRRPDIYNSASVITPTGAWTERYDKIHLVPFGEYVPFEKLFSFASGLTRQIGTFARGNRACRWMSATSRAGVFICYESIFPNEMRQFARNGAEVFVNVSNDGWYGEGGAPRQHLNMARMRAVENDRWLLRDTNTGITAVIDPYGRVVAEAPRNQRVALQGSIFAGAIHDVLHAPRRLVPVAVCDNHVAGAVAALRRAGGDDAAAAGIRSYSPQRHGEHGKENAFSSGFTRTALCQKSFRLNKTSKLNAFLFSVCSVLPW